MYYIYNTFLIKFAKKMLLLTEKLLQGWWKQNKLSGQKLHMYIAKKGLTNP